MDPVTLRALERILVVLFAGMAIYLGYRLFLAVPTQRGSDGKVTLPGGAEVMLNRAAPGLFFALFGSIALGISLYSAVQATHAPAAPPAQAAVGGEPVLRHYSGVVPSDTASPGRPRDAEFELAQLRRLLFTLNALDAASSAEGADAVAQRSDLRQVKLRLLQGGWQEAWGSHADFAAWVGQSDARGEPPDGRFAIPAALYHQGGAKP
ncbi:hypothetical protein ACM26W_03410 [Halomonas sp. HK25]|uniref:hypothetical protein n=1 Tax=Halomonas sp. HK25 TaxID=3394321 RepID=UPI0039FBDAEE